MEELADSFLALDDVIRIGESVKGERFTTRAIWELESGALRTAEQMAGSEGNAVVPRVLASRPT